MNEGNTGAGGAQVGTGGSLSADAAGRPVISDDSNVEDGSVLSIDHGQQDVGVVQQVASIQPTMQADMPGATVVEPMVNTTSTLSTTGAPVVSSQSVSSNTIPDTVANLDPSSISSTDPVLDSSLSANSVSANTSQPAPRPISRFQSADQLVSQTFAAGGVPVRPNISGSVQQLVQNSPMPSPYLGQSAFSIANSAGSEVGNEDVVLTSNGKVKSSKKKVLLFLAAIGVVGLIAGVCLIVVNGGFLNSGVSIDKMHASLNRYANYLLYGNDSSETVAYDATWTTKNLDRVLNKGQDEAKGYIDELEILYDGFVADFYGSREYTERLDEEDMQFYDLTLDNNKEALDALSLFVSTPELKRKEMWQIYLEKGLDALIEVAEERYDVFLKSQSANLRKLGNMKILEANTIGGLYELYRQFGCIEGDRLSDYCVEEVSRREDVAEQLSVLDDLDMGPYGYDWKLKDSVISISETVYYQINEGRWDEE